MTTLISFIIVLGVLIFIHELGHFAVAKWSGVKVEKFSLGFGPKLIGIRRGETEYLISALPLGGYVKMVGEAPGEDVTEADRARSFTAKPVSTRASIVAAGPIMNLVLAVLLMPLIFLIGIKVPAYLEAPATVGYVVPDEAAAKAGIAAGDTIEKVDGQAIGDWETLLASLAMNPGKPLELTVRRGSDIYATKIVPDTSEETGAGYGGMMPPMKPVIGAVSSGYPAAQSGVLPGDEIVSVDGSPVTHWAELEGIIHKSGGKKVFVLKRGEELITKEITPSFNEEMNVYLVGISRQEDTVTKKYGLSGSIKKGVETSIDMTARLFAVIKGLIVGDYSLKTLGGPIMIAQVAGKAAESGLTDLLSLVAFLSLQLGIINLFPIPVLDGGHITFFILEYFRGKPLSERFMGVAQQVGVALLVALMVLVTYNDIFRILR